MPEYVTDEDVERMIAAQWYEKNGRQVCDLDGAFLRQNIRRIVEGIVERDRKPIREIVNQQAEDGGLWFEATTAPEAYLQQELRRLHEIVGEG